MSLFFKWKKKSGRSPPERKAGQAGSIFTVLLAGIAMASALSLVLYQTISGPMSSMVRVTNKTSAKATMQSVANITIMNAINQTYGSGNGDCDGDGSVEPPGWRTGPGGTGNPTGGGLIPINIGAPVTDPWGTDYGYCVWDVGSIGSVGGAAKAAACDTDATGTGANLRRRSGTLTPATSSAKSNTVIAIISAGPNRRFETTCSDYVNETTDEITQGGDDIVLRFTYQQAASALDSLWSLKTGAPTTATIGTKNIEVGTGSAGFNVGLPANITQTNGVIHALAVVADGRISSLGAVGLGNDTNVTNCAAANAGDMRYFAATKSIQVCDGAGTWNAATGTGAGGGGRLDQITAATATATIDSLLNPIVWNWSTLATGMTALTLADTNTANSSATTLAVNNATTGAGFGIYVTMSGSSGSGTAIYASNHSANAGATGILGSMNNGTGASNGVAGWNNSTTAGAAGVYGNMNSANDAGYGVWGDNTGTTNTGFGGYFSNSGGGAALGINGFLTQLQMAAPAVSAANTGRIYFDSTSKTFQLSQNGSAYAPLGGGATSLDALTDVIADRTTGHNLLMGNPDASYHVVSATGQYNVAVGESALVAETTGIQNTALGYQSLYSNTTGTGNTALGYQALESNTTGSEITAVGNQALNNSTADHGNTAVGDRAMYHTNGGNNNTVLGYEALWANTTGNNNTALGINALLSNVAKNESTAVGFQAMMNADSGAAAVTYNTAVGAYALMGSGTAANNTGTGNTALGWGALVANTSGASNNALGAGTLTANTTGTGNVAIGGSITVQSALQANIDGSTNIAIGVGALGVSAHANSDVAVGANALAAFTGLDQGMTAIGTNALNGSVTGDNSTAVGRDALILSTGGKNTAVGSNALAASVGPSENTAVGYAAMKYANSTASTAVTYNTAVGAYALQGSATPANNTGTQNTAVGHSALAGNTSGTGNTVVGYGAMYLNSAGSANTAVGVGALDSNGSNGGSTAVGYYALYSSTGGNNTALGDGAGYTGTANVAGTNNTFIGYQAQASNAGLTNATALGNGAIVAVNNSISLGNSSVTAVTTAGNLFGKIINTANANDSAQTLTAASMVGGMITRSGMTAIRADTTDTAANIIAAIPNANTSATGTSFYLYIKNTTAFTNTLAGGTGVTIVATTANEVASATTLYLVQVTSGTTVTMTKVDVAGVDTSGGGGVAKIDDLSDARYDITTDHNMILGQKVSLTAGAQGNVFVGELAGATAAHSLSGMSSNTAVGKTALQALTGGYGNNAFGNGTLNANTTGNNNVAVGGGGPAQDDALMNNSTGSSNTAVGAGALAHTTADGNTALGFYAGNAGTANVGGTYNTFIGYQAQANGAAYTNSTAIGANAVVGASNSLVLGSSANVGINKSTPYNSLSVESTAAPYATGTASQSTTAITGVGTTFTAAMVGSTIVYANGVSELIKGFTDTTHLTASVSQTVASQAFSIYYPGLEVTSGGQVGIGILTPATVKAANDNPNTKLTINAGVGGASTVADPVRGLRIMSEGGYGDGMSFYSGTSNTIGYIQYTDTANSWSTGAGDMIFAQASVGNASDWKMTINRAGLVGIGGTFPTALLHVAPLVSANYPALRVTGAINTTNNTASTETPDLDLVLNRVEKWATGALATQEAVKIAAPTYTFAGASTLTNAASLGIVGAPAAGANATLTNTHGLLISTGVVSGGVATTNSYGLTVNAMTGATNNYAAQFMGGNVGFGNAAPAEVVDVTGNVKVSNAVKITPVAGSAPTYSGGATSIDTLTDAIADRTTGHNLLMGNLDASYNVVPASGQYNVAVGEGALVAETTGANNTALGYDALQTNATSSQSTAVGYQALQNDTAQYNTAVGSNALQATTGGGGNTAVGLVAGGNNTIGGNNVALGAYALVSNVAKSDSTAVGGHAMEHADSTTTANPTYNTAVGAYALQGSATPANNTGNQNTAIGHSALASDTSGNINTAVGYNALNLNTNGAQNVAVGVQALQNNISNNNNTAVGVQALQTNTADNNVAVGFRALQSNTTGASDTAVGYTALQNNTTATNNTAVGFQALNSNVAKKESTAVGFNAMYYADSSATTAITYNTAVGAYALQGSATASANIGTNNTAIGHSALANNTSGSSNTAVGDYALNANTTTQANTAVGYTALQSTTGGSNTALGYQAGQAGTANTTGTYNTFIGYNAQANGAAYTDSTALGANAVVSASHQIMLGASTVTATRTNGHMEYTGTAPAVSACGTSPPAAVGNDNAMVVTTGTAAPTACTVTFNVAWTNTPVCTITSNTAAMAPYISAASTTAITFTTAAATSVKFYILCRGWY